MGTLKKLFNFTLQNSGFLSSSISRKQLNIRNNYIQQVRFITFYPISKNLQYISNDDNLDISVDQKTMKLNKPIEKPLCYMMTWLNAKNDHVTKYANIYLDKGFDIFNMTCTPLQLMFPTWGTQPSIKNFLKFMEQNNSNFDPIVVHGFSVAGYMWGEVCKYANEDLPKYQPLFDQIKCQTWDSAPDVAEFTVGVASGLFPHNKVLQTILISYAKFHKLLFYYTSTRHYNTSSKYLHLNLARSPALFLVSKTDPVGTVSSNWGFKTSWEKLGVKTTWQCWDESPHVQHIHTHPEEYVATVNKHLKDNVPMLKDI